MGTIEMSLSNTKIEDCSKQLKFIPTQSGVLIFYKLIKSNHHKKDKDIKNSFKMSSSFVAVRALRTAINNGNAPWRSYASTSKVNKKQNKQSITASTSTVDSKNLDPPQNVYKKIETKEIGPGASKQGDYKNPEYYSYHTMSFAEMDVVLSKLRVPQPSAK